MKSWSVFIALFVSIAVAGAAKRPPVAYPEPKMKWDEAFETGGAVVASPALSADGLTLYVGSADRNFYAIYTDDGSLKWSVRLPAAINDSATIDDEGTIYVPCANGALYALIDEEDTFSYKWTETINGVERPRPFRALRPGLTSPAITDDGTIYIGSPDNRLYALFSEDGAVMDGWPLIAPNDVDTPVVATTTEDGEGDTIYFVSAGRLYGVSFDGDEQSLFTQGTAIHSIPAIGEDGSIYFGADNERVYGLASGGTTNDIRWRFNTGENVTSSPVIGVSGDIYIGSESSRLYCFSTNGIMRWSISTKRPVHSALSIGADGTIYAGSDDKNMYAVTADGKIRWAFPTGGRVRSAAAIDSEGTIYFGSSDKKIYAIADSAPSDDGENVWPMFRRDRYHSARATQGTPFISQEPLGTNVSASFIASNVVNGTTAFVVTNGARSLNVTNGENVLVSVIARAGAAVTYQWRLDGENIDSSLNPSAATTTLVLKNVQPADAGVYTVAIENDFDVAYSDEFRLAVISAPVLTMTLTNQLLLAGGTLSLNPGAQGTQPLFFQWLTNGVPIPGQTNATLTITNVQPGDSGLYSVTVMNSVGTNNSTAITVTVFPVTLTLAEHPLGAGPRHSLAVLPDHTLWTWGLNNFGQLGNSGGGSTGTNLVFASTPQFIGIPTTNAVNTNAVWASVSAGGRGADVATNQPGGFSLAIQTNGTLWAWGANHFGQLGFGTTTLQRSPAQVGSDSNWFQVEAGATHTLGLKRDGSLWAWGANNVGQLGFGNTNATTFPSRVGTESAWVEIRAGGFFSLARRADGTIWAWGTNTIGQLGLGTNTNQRSPARIGTDSDWAALSAGVDHALALKTNGTLWAWGQNASGQLGTGTGTGFPTNRPVQIGLDTDWLLPEAGNVHTLALKTNDSLAAWGGNAFGQLGDGQPGFDRVLPTPIATDKTWLALDASTHSLGMTTDGRVWAWGWNSHGQVGDGSTNNRSTPVILNFMASNSATNPPTISQQPATRILNEMATATFSVNAFGSGILTYQWYFNSNAIDVVMNASAASSLLSITNITSTNAGFYHAIVTNDFGRVTSVVARLIVTITNGVPVIVQNPTNQTVNTNATVSFAVTVSGAQPFVYQWRFNLAPIDAVTNATATNAMLTLSNVTSANQGFYDVVVTNIFGMATSTPAQLVVTNGTTVIITPTLVGAGAKTSSLHPLHLKNITFDSGGVTIEVSGGSTGKRLVLECKESLNDSEWRPLSTNDSGAVKLYDATAPADRSRFYRARTE